MMVEAEGLKVNGTNDGTPTAFALKNQRVRSTRCTGRTSPIHRVGADAMVLACPSGACESAPRREVVLVHEQTLLRADLHAVAADDTRVAVKRP